MGVLRGVFVGVLIFALIGGTLIMEEKSPDDLTVKYARTSVPPLLKGWVKFLFKPLLKFESLLNATSPK